MNENEVKNPEHLDVMQFILIVVIMVLFILIVWFVVSMAVNFPRPSGTSTATPISSPTPTPTQVLPTDTPTQALPTNTSTIPAPPADTPTMKPPTPTPTATPTPKPDAVVNTVALNLRSGPGTDYEILGVLKQGDFLQVAGRNLEGDWLKVIAPGGKEGWAARSLLQVNVDMTGVAIAQAPPTPTPMYTPTPTPTPTPALLPPPILLEPENGGSFIAEPVLFKWQWDEPLAQDEYFSLRVCREKECKGEEIEPCHHNQVQNLEYWGDLTHCSDGEHYWGVALVRKLCENCPEEEKWQDLSETSAERWIHYTPGEEPWLPPPPTPDDGDGDGNGDGGPPPKPWP